MAQEQQIGSRLPPPLVHTDSTPPSDSHVQSPSSNAPRPASAKKDPSRPKRKKARRACLACQRAHLTCGDERPCERCIKRGLKDSCHNGMRKKAKYLHDAPDEALVTESRKEDDDRDGEDDITETFVNAPYASGYGDDSTALRPGLARYGSEIYGESNATAREGVQAHMLQQRVNNEEPSASLQGLPFTSMPQAMNMLQSTQTLPQMTGAYDAPLFDLSDPGLVNFDTSSLDFGNHYGALEFGMLGHMSSGANDGFMHPSQQQQSYGAGLGQNGYNSGFLAVNGPVNSMHTRQPSITDWQANPVYQGLTMNSWNPALTNSDAGLRHDNASNEPHAFTIGAVPGYGTESPASSVDFLTRYDTFSTTDNSRTVIDASPTPATFLRLTDPSAHPSKSQAAERKQRRSGDLTSTNKFTANTTMEAPARKLDLTPISLVPAYTRKRHRSPSSIYSSVTKPYPYTLGFHALTAVLQRRFSSQKRLLIAQALASIRPSFISCTRTLMEDDLLFMEKCFQRQLLEYEDFVSACGTPTIVCRRTGEVAYAGKEFCLLTGWEKEVLLGEKQNHNANVAGGSGKETGSTSRQGGVPGSSGRDASGTGVVTPRHPYSAAFPGDESYTTDTYRTIGRGNGNNSASGTDGNAAPPPAKALTVQPVFLAELLDDNSVIRFYEDFAKLAFADSKGSAWSPCKLLKYRTEEEVLRLGLEREKKRRKEEQEGRLTAADEKEKGEGWVECMYCWTVKRDVFDIPMMIVINFLPIM